MSTILFPEKSANLAFTMAIIVECYSKFLSDINKKFNSQMPNTTVLCVSNPNKSISFDAIRVVDEGPVEE
jgi:hypothetical protein